MKRFFAIVAVLTILLTCFSLSADAVTFNVDFETAADSLYLVNLDTDTVVFDKNGHNKMFPASTTKIMTYIVTVENVGDLKNTKVLVDSDILSLLDGTGSSLSGLQNFSGEYVTVYDLLECLMIKSGNDAALLLANHVGGSIQDFVDMMNAKAEEIGCKNTHFMNPHGLHDENHYTTAEDLVTMARYAQTLPEFSEISSKVTAYLSIDKEQEYPLVTTNYMIDDTRGGSYYYEYAKGIKTGTTDEAGYCLVSTASKDGYTYMCVALGAPSVTSTGEEIEENGAMLTSKAMYEWAFNTLENKSVITEDTIVCEVPVELAWEQDTVHLVPQVGYSAILPNNIEGSSIDMVTDVPKSLTAPIIEGTVIGTVTISYANQELTTVNLIAEETIERSKLLYFLDRAKMIIHSKWMIVSILVVIVLIVIYTIITVIYNSKKKKRKKRKKVQQKKSI
ncbi:MAG: D-alanyl-D-alanine carboxypeptidase [Lachnospiraceae bacterium]|nr:D-alanyl-D-alanine carboxypeptidase [Lachnospiraceae bacterium]